MSVIFVLFFFGFDLFYKYFIVYFVLVFHTFFNLFVFHLHVDIVSPLLLNASLLLVLTTDYSD